MKSWKDTTIAEIQKDLAEISEIFEGKPRRFPLTDYEQGLVRDALVQMVGSIDKWLKEKESCMPGVCSFELFHAKKVERAAYMRLYEVFCK